MSKVPYVKAKHADMKLIEKGGGGGGGTSLVLTDLVVYNPPDSYEYPIDEPIMYDGMVLMAQYENDYYRDVTDIATYSIPKGTVLENDYEGAVTFTYEENGVKVQATLEITVVSGVTWTSSKAGKLIEAFEAAYAGDTEILSNLAVGDIREVQLLDGTTVHFVLAQKSAYNHYSDSGFTDKGKTMFAVTMQEAYPKSAAVIDSLAWKKTSTYYEHYIPDSAGQATTTTFYSLIPEDIRPLFKIIRGTYYSGSSSSGYSAPIYGHFLSPVYQNYTNSVYGIPYGSVSIVPRNVSDGVQLYNSAGGYYDNNTVDKTKDVFSQSNRVFRNIHNPQEYVSLVWGRGCAVSSRNSNYYYSGYKEAYNCIANYGTVAPALGAGLTFVGAV